MLFFTWFLYNTFSVFRISHKEKRHMRCCFSKPSSFVLTLCHRSVCIDKPEWIHWQQSGCKNIFLQVSNRRIITDCSSVSVSISFTFILHAEFGIAVQEIVPGNTVSWYINYCSYIIVTLKFSILSQIHLLNLKIA